jgi:methionyl-tRNA synthetase
MGAVRRIAQKGTRLANDQEKFVRTEKEEEAEIKKLQLTIEGFLSMVGTLQDDLYVANTREKKLEREAKGDSRSRGELEVRIEEKEAEIIELREKLERALDLNTCSVKSIRADREKAILLARKKEAELAEAVVASADISADICVMLQPIFPKNPNKLVYFDTMKQTN